VATDQPVQPTFVERQRQIFTDAAVAEARHLQALRHETAAALNLGHGERIVETLELDPGLVVAQIDGGHFGTVWRLVAAGKPHYEAYPSKPAAILAAIGHANKAGDSAWMFAARVLNVPDGTEETAR
jgi:hypothetical protein